MGIMGPLKTYYIFLYSFYHTFGAIFATFSANKVERILEYLPKSMKPPGGTFGFLAISAVKGLCKVRK